MTVRGDGDSVVRALGELRGSMAVDGYQLDVYAVSADAVGVAVVATEGACEDCLVPADVLKMIISGSLDAAYTPEEIQLSMPAGH